MMDDAFIRVVLILLQLSCKAVKDEQIKEALNNIIAAIYGYLVGNCGINV